jgi:hypothetical protein
MSCYEWESGTVKIPARQFKEFCKRILEAAGPNVRTVAAPQGAKTHFRHVIDMDDAAIILDTGDCLASWDVPENNHACEHARAHPIAKAFFRALGQIEWSRGSGGVIVGNDEYNRDGRGLDDGGNYEVAYYGPPRKTKSSRRFR